MVFAFFHSRFFDFAQRRESRTRLEALVHRNVKLQNPDQERTIVSRLSCHIINWDIISDPLWDLYCARRVPAGTISSQYFPVYSYRQHRPTVSKGFFIWARLPISRLTPILEGGLVWLWAFSTATGILPYDHPSPGNRAKVSWHKSFAFAT